MKKMKILLFSSYVTVLFLAGCATERFEAAEQICFPLSDKAYVMEATEDVLARMNFSIEKADLKQGLIRTRPLRAAQSFEFWRRDNTGQFNTAEANLHTIRRTAELRLSESESQTCVVCDAQVQRMSLPPREVASVTQLPKMFTKSKSSMQRLRLQPEQEREMTWINLGNDIRLETKILNQIQKKLKTTN